MSNALHKTGNNHRRLHRFLECAAFFIAGVAFSSFGVLAIRNGGIVLGLGFTAVGLATIAGAGLNIWRGDKIGVRLVGNNLIIRHYFVEKSVPIETIQRFYRSVDSTVLETFKGKVVFNDSLFDDFAVRDALLQSLQERLFSTSAIPSRQGPRDVNRQET